jgi:RNA polymerase sigma factor (sigma-70 family)
MAHAFPTALLASIRHFLARQTTSGVPDVQLLHRFIVQSDEAAFAALMEQHGPMVWSVCRRVLGQEADADDAFQATFLVLARKAGSISRRKSLGSWLHGVAWRLAVKARSRRKREIAATSGPSEQPLEGPLGALAWRELQTVLDEELARLPAKFRAPLVMCYLEGQTHEEAARQLALPVGTVNSRLARGRDLLRKRLIRRGLALSASGFGTAWAASMAPAAVPTRLLEPTLRSAVAFAAGKAADTAVSAAVLLLAQGSTAVLSAGKGALAVGLLLTVGLMVFISADRLGEPTAVPDDKREAAANIPVRVDLYGDPLPTGALARLGSVRYRGAGGPMVFLPGGKALISGGYDGAISKLDVATGTYEKVPIGTHATIHPRVFSADSQLFAGYLYDTPGRMGRVGIWHVSSGKRLSSFDVDKNSSVVALTFSPDSKTLGVAGWKMPIGAWEVSSGKELWKVTSQGNPGSFFNPSIAFSPDGKVVAGRGEKEGLYLWETATGTRIREIGKAEQTSAIAFSPNGKQLAAVTYQVHRSTAPNGVVTERRQAQTRLWELDSGKEIAVRDQEGSAVGVAFSPDGAILAANHVTSKGTYAWGPLDIGLWETSTGKKVRGFLGGWYMTFSQDGATLASNYGAPMLFHDVATGKPLHDQRPCHQGPIWSVAFAPDGKSVVTEDRYLSRRQWDTATGKQLQEAAGRPPLGRQWHYAPDGKTVAWIDDRDGFIHLSDCATNKEVWSLKGRFGETFLAFAPDGKILAGADARNPPRVCLWDAATGKELAEFKGPPGGPRFTGVAFSPDSKVLALGCQDGTLRLSDAATGKEVRKLDLGLGPSNYSIYLVAFSPNGKTVAVSNEPGHVCLLEVATGKQRRLLKTDRDLSCLSFSGDSMALVTGNYNTMAMVWDVTGARTEGRIANGELAPKDLATLWSDLGSTDAEAAYRAIGAMVVAPRQSLPYLRKRVQPAGRPDARHIAGLIADLQNNKFAVREKASADLELLGELARPALDKVLANQPPLETRQRVERVLEKLEPGQTPPLEILRVVRTLEVLESLGTAEARHILQTLTEGAPQARVTEEAKASLTRLTARAASHP